MNAENMSMFLLFIFKMNSRFFEPNLFLVSECAFVCCYMNGTDDDDYNLESICHIFLCVRPLIFIQIFFLCTQEIP